MSRFHAFIYSCGRIFCSVVKHHRAGALLRSRNICQPLCRGGRVPGCKGITFSRAERRLDLHCLRIRVAVPKCGRLFAIARIIRSLHLASRVSRSRCAPRYRGLPEFPLLVILLETEILGEIAINRNCYDALVNLKLL